LRIRIRNSTTDRPIQIPSKKTKKESTKIADFSGFEEKEVIEAWRLLLEL
jgi:hypothetical protein